MIIVVHVYPNPDDTDTVLEEYYGPFATEKVAEDYAEKLVDKIRNSSALVTTLTEPT